MSDGSRIIVALDGLGRERALTLAKSLSGLVWGFKVNDLLVSEGARIVTELTSFGKVFADPKLHDIPNTVANGVAVLARAGAELITVHASGGRAMLREAVAKAGSARILAVSILTSLGDSDAGEIYRSTAAEGVRRFVELAASESVHGIVCSPQELDLVAGVEPRGGALLKVIPGIRPSWYGKKDDQVRVLGPAEAVSRGASLLVIGRPITEHEDPRKAVQLLAEELA